jgi:hypothetical protein
MTTLRFAFLILSTTSLIIACGGSAEVDGSKNDPSSSAGAKPTGSAGAKGDAGSASGGAGGGASTCHIPECIRAVECVAHCGGPVLVSSCCACANGTFDRQNMCDSAGGAGSGGSAGAAQGGASGPPAIDLTDLNTPCVNGACTGGLTPLTYYGLSGPSGPSICTCSISCEKSPSACPAGTRCANYSDGPGPVCSL